MTATAGATSPRSSSSRPRGIASGASPTIRWTFRVRTAHDIFGFADGRTLRPKGDAEDLASVSIAFDHQHRET